MSCFQALPVNFGVLKSRAEHNSISIWGFQSGPRARLDLRMFSRLNGEHRDHPFQELWFGLARLRATGATLVRPETCSFRGKCVATGFAVLWIWDRKAGTIATDASSDKAKLNPKVGILQISGSTGGVFWIDWVQIGFDQCRFDPGVLNWTNWYHFGAAPGRWWRLTLWTEWCHSFAGGCCEILSPWYRMA